ncbi:CCA tRNA nucleotidyltransferase [Porphyrobacter sp. GA68]|uniref:CCA tRNA nucleotidyltransferase n=1 Tax=Porphyrobacter sp. GA68 TaxID=2883480 RepID=UPI001D1971C1|nr:CCA tRNA nucleotidyltransferase [Porphyrobacter sp. GA68]
MADLSRAEWTRRADLAGLIAALGREEVRYVGGAVRDTLLGLEAKDIDIATTHLPVAVMARCQQAGIRTVPTGIEHGTVTVLLPGGPVEVTTLRRDVSTDGRRATVAFSTQWRDDAARRDFTINALYADPDTLEVQDFFGGLDDLAARRIRFIGEPRQRIAEDHLRILRYFRFQARFGDTPDADALAACSALANTLKGLSRERIAMELLSILALPDPAPTVELMHAAGVLPVILPEAGRAQRNALGRLVQAEQAQAIAPDPVRRLAALLPPVAACVEDVAARLRLSKAQRARLICVAERTPEDREHPRPLAYRQGLDCARDRLLLLGGDAGALTRWEVPRFPLTGKAVIARGLTAGPDVARLLREAEARWVAAGFPDEAAAARLLDEVVAQQ